MILWLRTIEMVEEKAVKMLIYFNHPVVVGNSEKQPQPEHQTNGPRFQMALKP